VLLALAGGAGGVLIAGWITSAVPLALGRLPFPVEVDLALDLRVLLYSLVVSCGAALIFGLAPARRAAAGSLTAALKDEAGASGRQRLRHALVIGQVAVCSALLLWGGLFTRSLANVGSIDPGFDPDGVLLADLPISDLAGGATDESARESAVREFHERALAMPGVRAVGMGFVVPLALFSREEYGVRIDTPGAEPRAGRVVANTVTPGFFGAIRIPVISGRDFTWRDRQGAPPVVIVNQTAARRFWNGSAVGRRLQIPDDDRWMTVDVVGVVGDSKYWTLGEEIAPTVYTPYSQRFSGNTLFVRTTDMPAAAGALRAELRRRAPNQPIEVQPMTASIGVAIMPARVGAIVTTTFGVVAMLLSVMGIYGMVAFSVAQRRREIGIRRAIGARARDIVRVVIGGSLARAVAGLAIGIGAGCLLAQAFRGFIVNVSTADPLTIAAVLAAVTGVTLAASTLPALRASRIDPLATLRQD
jgi:putative ABC transport system permease protein